MKPDEFEQDLRCQLRRPVPSEWRGEILEAARAAAREGVGRPQEEEYGRRFPSWRQWFWPCPQAWAGLAAVWLILLGFQLATVSTRSAVARRSPSSEVRMALAAQRRELARLLDVPADPAPAPRPTVPGPRSELILSPKV
ncbi:MAG TPA: hypothetical protein VNH84_09635 [Candidatus Saccharimonadales bacterium]|nr:hypothetical protein [Candidatus Saccharimonadales bacterium]